LCHFRYLEGAIYTCSITIHYIIRDCIVSIHLYSAAYSAHQSDALPVRKTQRESFALAVLRERKQALGSPVNKVDRVEGRSWFQSEGPMIAKGEFQYHSTS